MSAISNIRKNLSSTGSSIIVGLIVFVLVATFGGFIGNSNISNNEIFSVNGKGIHIGEFNLEANRISSSLIESQDFTEEPKPWVSEKEENSKTQKISKNKKNKLETH